MLGTSARFRIALLSMPFVIFGATFMLMHFDAKANDTKATSAASADLQTEGKLVAPIRIELQPRPLAASGERQVAVVVRPLVNAKSVEVNVVSGGQPVPGGKWTVPGKKNHSSSRTVVTHVKDRRTEPLMIVTATVVFADGQRQTAVASFEPEGREVIAPRGIGGVIEIPAGEP